MTANMNYFCNLHFRKIKLVKYKAELHLPASKISGNATL